MVINEYVIWSWIESITVSFSIIKHVFFFFFFFFFFSKASKTMVDTIHEEITKETVSLLNEDWLQYPQLRFCLSQLLAGAILIDGTSALVINSIEPYCRDVLLDAHHERRLFDSATSYSQTPLFAPLEFRPRGVQKAGVCKNRECKK